MTHPIIEIKHLSRIFQMGQYQVDALRDINLTIHAGEFVAIKGPSGSGKSTLMYLIGCLDTPSSGEYRLCGQEISQLDDQEISRLRNRQIGFVFQQFCLLSELDVLENTALGMTYAGTKQSWRRSQAQELADQVGLGNRIDHRPSQLSGGQQQRVAIARAMVGQPQIILADEPTGNLDTHTSDEIMERLHKLNTSGKTVILVTHDHKVAEHAERIITLVDGRVVSDKRTARESPLHDDAGIEPETRHNMTGNLRNDDLIKMALREGLLAHKLRSMLTMLGIIFGIAAVIAMTAITEGGKQHQLEQLRQIGMNNIQVRDLDLQAASLLRQRRINPRGVTLDDMQYLRQHINGVGAVAAWKVLTAEIRYGSTVVGDVDVVGVHGEFESVANYHVVQGRFIDTIDEQRFARVCAIGPEIADELNLGVEPVGKAIIIGDQPFVVVGVMQSKLFTDSQIADISIANRNRQIFVPHRVLRFFFRKDEYASELDAISLRMQSDAELVGQSKLINHIVSQLHLGAEDFGIFVPLEKLMQAQQTKRVFNVIIVVIAGISLIVGGIGIMNIMLANVTERTREIGIRRAMGASRRHVLHQFLVESLLIALFGGFLGLLAGIGSGLLVQQIFGLRVAFGWPIMAMATLVSMAVGIAFGIYPAWLAANKNPVEALRN